MPDFLMPLVIGTLVTAAVILALKLLLLNSETNSEAAAQPKKETDSVSPRPPSRPDLKKDSRSRIATLARQTREQRFKHNRDNH